MLFDYGYTRRPPIETLQLELTCINLTTMRNVQVNRGRKVRPTAAVKLGYFRLSSISVGSTIRTEGIIFERLYALFLFDLQPNRPNVDS